jgi:hypothetical protein
LATGDGFNYAMTKAQHAAGDVIKQRMNALDTELRTTRAEIARLQAINNAAETERDSTTQLN